MLQPERGDFTVKKLDGASWPPPHGPSAPVGWIRDNYKGLETGTSTVALGVGKIGSKTPYQGKPSRVQSMESVSFFYDSELSFLLFQFLHVVLSVSPSQRFFVPLHHFTPTYMDIRDFMWLCEIQEPQMRENAR